MNKRLLVLLALLALARPAAAQTVRADRVTLNTGPCVITSGPTAPNGTRVGNPCDTFLQNGTGAIWTKTSGVGTSSGWLATLAGAGTAGALVKWTGTGATLGDSLVSEAGGLVTVAGNASITGLATMNGASITGNASIGGTATITGNTTLGGSIGTANYASQVTGWRITAGGAADVRYLYTDELRAKLFTADAESVLAGSLRVTKSYSTLAQALTCPAANTSITLWAFDAATYANAPVFQDGDWVVMHVLTRSAFGPFTIADCVGTVTSYADGTGGSDGAQSWVFTRAAGANGGSMVAGSGVVPLNALVQDMGTPGTGYVEISALDGANGVNAPYLQTNTWTTAPIAANTSTTCRLGNLTGLTSVTNEYGLVCSRGALFDPTVAGIRLSNQTFQIRNVPLDYWNASTQVLSFDPTGPTLAMGNPIPTAFGGGNTGFWMGRDTADNLYKLRIGNATGNRLTWNGSVLSIIGEGSGITNINGGNIQAGTITAAAINVTPNGAALNNDPNALSSSAWTEQANPGYQALSTRVTDGVAGYYSMRSPTGHTSVIAEAKLTPVDGGHKSYRLHAWVRAGGGSTGSFLMGVLAYDASGTGSGGAFATSTVTGPLPTTWTEFSGILPLPTTTAAVAPILYLNYDASLVQPGWMEAQDIRLEEVLPSTLIKDGAITTAKIQAGAITAHEIAANTITVANLNASGFGDNLIKNSTFEGPPSQALAGWMIDPATGGTMTQNCCGTRGPGTLLISPTGAGAFSLVLYYAVPVTIGAPYRVALDVYATTATANGMYVRMFESNSTAAPRYVGTSTFTTPDVPQDTNTDLYANGPLVQGWNHLEFIYTPPSPVRWVSFGVYDYTGMSGTFQVLHLDGVEMEAQIGAGSIRANSITAGQIAAGTITAAQIAAGTITATQIAANTITGNNLVANTITSAQIGVGAIVAGNLAANTITSAQIAANTITGGNIAGGTITGGNIAGQTITADKLTVTSLSAISANLGSITAGNINAVTISGSSISGGTVNGTAITGGSININGGNFQVDSSGNVVVNGSINVNGTSNIQSLQAGYSSGLSTVVFNGTTYQASGGYFEVWNLQNGGNRFVCADNNGRLYPATNGTTSATC